MAQVSLTFYAEWLSLPKEQFRILAMLADTGEFSGNLSDVCRYFSVNPQTRNRNAIRSAIEELQKQCYIKADLTGRTYRLSIIPKAEEISMPQEWAQRIIRHEYNTEAVSWEAVLKVMLWLTQNDQGTITNGMIAADLGVSEGTVVAAKNVLEREYKAFIKKYDYEITSADYFRRKGVYGKLEIQ